MLLLSAQEVTALLSQDSTSFSKLVRQFIGLKLSIELGFFPGFKIGMILVTLKTEGKVEVKMIQFIR